MRRFSGSGAGSGLSRVSGCRGGGASAILADPFSNTPVTVAKDGSVGDTYTAPSGWTGLQWYRVALAAPNQATAIAGANAATYVAQASDEGCRLAVRGRHDAVLKRISARCVVLAQPHVLAQLDSLTDVSIHTGSPLLDIVDGRLEIQCDGSAAVDKVNIGAFVDVASLGTIVYFEEVIDPDGGHEMAGPGLRFSQSYTFSSTGQPPMGITYQAKGGAWFAAHASEASAFSGFTPGTQMRVQNNKTASSSSPYRAKLRCGPLLSGAQGRPTFVLGFDDNFTQQYTVAFPIMAARGLAGTIYVAPDIIDGGGRMSVAQLQELKAAGWDMQMDGTANDAAITSKFTNTADAVAEIGTMSAWLAGYGLNDHAEAICYPNGTFQANGTRTLSFSIRSSGSPIVTMTDTTGIAAGYRAVGVGVPVGTMVISVDSATQVTLSANCTSAGSNTICFHDDGGAFDRHKLMDALAGAGIKLARTTDWRSWYTRFGFSGQGIQHPGVGWTNVTDFTTQAQSRFDTAILRGETLVSYMHAVYDGATGLNTPAQVLADLCDYLAAKRDAGLCDVLTISQLIARDYGAICPV